MGEEKAIFDLEERTGKFGEDIIDFAKTLPETIINKPLISQVIRSGTSLGANYMEANGAESKKDFVHKISICKKEAKETMHWFRMIAKANSDKKEVCGKLYQEVHELTKIFARTLSTCRKNSNNDN
ncbi:MAG: four helix bundle protein [Candidatus Parcubacteria bacterium]|nr:four helix bundle protein [Candidatus Parcubacteria bacterium]